MGQPDTIYAPSQVLSLLEQKGNLCLTSGRMGRYQAIILDNPDVSLKTVSKLNPVSLLPEPDAAALIYDCPEIIDEVYSSSIDL